MPIPDLGPRRSAEERLRIARDKAFARRLADRMRRRPPRGEAGGDPCPVTPDRPLDLSGGAAAALEFGD
ncbi:hypothetical protein D9601_00700 [Sphingomonas sp. MA1305]|uniref:hypothetical protein n=1 Tax=Sphingomonas sp. MA1305 TaxID=2479204 RepID=UPI0018DFDB28|nr:hypothetical protein [Sphingomonas sp. MA1305]MBI0473881.1 hypothetical protein [Sphingomonas sp. MA1305]